MTTHRLFLSLALAAAVALAPGAALAKKSEAQIQAELDSFVMSYVEKANKRMTVNRAKPRVVRDGNKFVASFTEIERESVSAELRQSRSKHFQYVARLRYQEVTYESEGKTRKAALKGPWRVVNMRRLTEMPRYVKG
ncbi:MAG: hypothetical protein IJY48_08245, partial [Mailhella sp.]|nr:hypothetical protein [Mailhella sp.]